MLSPLRERPFRNQVLFFAGDWTCGPIALRSEEGGKIKGPILRGLSARAPFFHNGSAQTLLDVVHFYESRFGLVLAPQEESDLIAFLSSL